MSERAPVVCESLEEIASFVSSLQSKGVQLWSQDGRLHYKAPRGVLSTPELARLRFMREQVLALLQMHSAGSPMPLSFSQLARWNFYQCGELRSCRQMAAAVRMVGPLQPDVLERSIAAVVYRQDALRTRIVACDGTPVQEVDPPGEVNLPVQDLSALPEPVRLHEIQRVLDECILEHLDLARGPLFVAKLLRFSAREHVLVVAMEHMISDAFSLNILLREILTAYGQLASGHSLALPPIGVQFAEHARRQRASVTDVLCDRWLERLKGCQRLRFSVPELDAHAPCGIGRVPIKVGRTLTAQLRQWARQQRTTLALTMFTAYVALVLRMCRVDEGVIQYEINGRYGPEVENTIGYFASQLYLRMQMHENDRFIDLLARAIQEYCRAHEQSVFSSCTAARVPRPEFARNTLFNWVPRGRSDIEHTCLAGMAHPIHCSTLEFEHPALRAINLDYEPSILLCETDEEIAGGIYFPQSRFSTALMECFARAFLGMAHALLGQPHGRIKDVKLEAGTCFGGL